MSKLDEFLDEYGEDLLELVGEYQDNPVQLLKEVQENGKTYKQQIKDLFLELIDKYGSADSGGLILKVEEL